MSLLFDERPVPVHVRTKLGLALPRISFGAPGPLDGADGYRYEISPEDRHVLDQTARDAGSGDPGIARLALDAIKTAAQFFPPAKLAIQVGEFIWNFLGLGVKGTGSLSDGALVFHGELNTGDYGPNGAKLVVTSASYDPLTGKAVLKGTGYAESAGCKPSSTNPERNSWGWNTGHAGFKPDAETSEYGSVAAEIVAGAITSINLPCEEIPQYLVDSSLLGPSWQPPDNALFQLVEATATLATHQVQGLRRGCP